MNFCSAQLLELLFGVQASGMNVVVKTGSTSVLLRDALRRPLAELELGGVKAGLRKLPKGVMQVSPSSSSLAMHLTASSSSIQCMNHVCM